VAGRLPENEVAAVPVAVLMAALPVGVTHSLSTALFGASATGYLNMLSPSAPLWVCPLAL